jgi:flagellar basal body-associated protein FliL
MPEMIGDIGTPSEGRGSVTVKIWILALAAVLLCAPYYLFYRMGYRNGFEAIFRPGISDLRRATRYSPPMYPLQGIRVNLADPGRERFLHASLQLALRSDAELSECALREAQLRDVLISFFTRHRSSDVDTETDRRRLKRLIKNELNATLRRARVTEVFFSEFQVRILKPENRNPVESSSN